MGVDTLNVNDIITVTGQIENYNGKLEFGSGCTLDEWKKGSRKVTVNYGPLSEDTAYKMEMKLPPLGKNVYFNGKISSKDYLQTGTYEQLPGVIGCFLVMVVLMLMVMVVMLAVTIPVVVMVSAALVMVVIMSAAAALMVIVVVMSTIAAFVVLVMLTLVAAAAGGMVLGFFSGNDNDAVFHGPRDFLELRDQNVRVFRGQPQLPGGKGDDGFLHHGVGIEFILHFGGAVCTAQVFHNVYLFYHGCPSYKLTYEHTLMCFSSVYTRSRVLSIAAEEKGADGASIRTGFRFLCAGEDQRDLEQVAVYQQLQLSLLQLCQALGDV